MAVSLRMGSQMTFSSGIKGAASRTFLRYFIDVPTNMRGRSDFSGSLHRQFKKRFTTEKFGKLFGRFFPGLWPKSGASSSG